MLTDDSQQPSIRQEHFSVLSLTRRHLQKTFQKLRWISPMVWEHCSARTRVHQNACHFSAAFSDFQIIKSHAVVLQRVAPKVDHRLMALTWSNLSPFSKLFQNYIYSFQRENRVQTLNITHIVFPATS